MNQNNIVELYTDGSCINNPGPGGIGYIVRYPDEVDGKVVGKEIEGAKGYRLTTNNRMELLAGILGLEQIADAIGNNTIKNCIGVIVVTDSKYFCDAINWRWIDFWQSNNWVKKDQQPVKNRDLWEMVVQTLAKFTSRNIKVSFNHINGHQGHAFNERCDALAVNQARTNATIVDEVYEKTAQKR
jgi:ribonuclease HI